MMVAILYLDVNLVNEMKPLIVLSGRAVASPYLGIVLVFMGFGRFQVSEIIAVEIVEFITQTSNHLE